MSRESLPTPGPKVLQKHDILIVLCFTNEHTNYYIGIVFNYFNRFGLGMIIHRPKPARQLVIRIRVLIFSASKRLIVYVSWISVQSLKENTKFIHTLLNYSRMYSLKYTHE